MLRLKSDPEAAGIEMLGRDWRGSGVCGRAEYRVLYRIEDGGKTVVVISIRPRPAAYRR